MSSSDYHLALPVGSVVHQYRVLAVLGQGGFGIVYKAEHELLGHYMAIKEYFPKDIAFRKGAAVEPVSQQETQSYEKGISRFVEEARQLLKFDSHPNIVSCRDLFQANNTAYLVMNFEDGKPLTDILNEYQTQGKKLSEDQILSIILPLLSGLSALHKQGVLHRDIKPANIFIRRADEQPVLIDFGAAKQNFSEHSKSIATYTVGYAAIEQVYEEGNLGPWTDLYAIGAVIWRIISGQNPKDSTSRAAAQLRNKPDTMASVQALGAGNYSEHFLTAVDQCLVINEEERCQSAEELLQFLWQYCWRCNH